MTKSIGNYATNGGWLLPSRTLSLKAETEKVWFNQQVLPLPGVGTGPTGCRRRNKREYRTYKTLTKLTTYIQIQKKKKYTPILYVGIFQQNHHDHEFQYGEFCSITPLEQVLFQKLVHTAQNVTKNKVTGIKGKKNIAITLSALIHSFEVHLQFQNYPLEICCAVGHPAYFLAYVELYLMNEATFWKLSIIVQINNLFKKQINIA